jgi:hypothetical protein
MKHLGWILAAVLSLGGGWAYAAETGYALKATQMKAEPFLDAADAGTIPEKAVVEILSRQGAWMKVKTRDARQGWVRMLSIRLGSPDQKPEGGNLLSALSLNSRPRPATTATVTTGVRGFSEEDLSKSTPNPAEAQKMKGFAVTPQQAAQFAEGGKLSRSSVGYFDEDGKPPKGKK